MSVGRVMVIEYSPRMVLTPYNGSSRKGMMAVGRAGQAGPVLTAVPALSPGPTAELYGGRREKRMDSTSTRKVARMTQNPCLFVVGCPRSGTTLLRRILNAHPELAIPKVETHWIPRFFRKRTGLTPDGRVTPELADHLQTYHRFPRLGIDRQDLDKLVARDRNYAEFTGRLFDLYGARYGKALVGDKTPGYVRHIGLLHELFPRAKFIHLVRDGRDVALSMLSWSRLGKSAGRLPTFREDPVGTTALFWEWCVRLGREQGSRLPAAQYHEIRYESLVDDPETGARELCAFLDLRFEPAMLEYYAGKQKTENGLSAKKAWLPPTSGLRDWRTQMSQEDLLRFEAVAGDLLDELGYTRAIADLPEDALAFATRLRDRFDRKPRPAAWPPSPVQPRDVS